jgi:hypothetical protein
MILIMKETDCFSRNCIQLNYNIGGVLILRIVRKQDPGVLSDGKLHSHENITQLLWHVMKHKTSAVWLFS